MAGSRTSSQGGVYQKSTNINNAIMSTSVMQNTLSLSEVSVNSSHADMYQINSELGHRRSNIPTCTNTPNCDNIKIADRISDINYIGGQRSQMKLGAWHHELSFLDDLNRRNYLLSGIRDGFPIVDSVNIPRYECSNYKSS